MSSDEQSQNFSPLRPVTQAASSVEIDSLAFALKGNSLANTQLRAQVRRVAPYFRSLSLTGEPGCGEEAVARMLHQLCPLHERAFVILNAAEAEERFHPEGTLEETSSWEPKDGLLFLSEAEKLSRTAQEGLMRMIRLQTAQSTRVVAFAGRGLKPYISAGYFLPELAGCLGSLRIALPTLRERAEDVPVLVQCWLEQYRMAQAALGTRIRPLRLSESFMELAIRFQWPENLQQLYRVLHWLMVNRCERSLNSGDLSAAIEASGQINEIQAPNIRLVKLDRVVQEHIRAVLLACNGNKLKAAEVLGISRSTLYRMLETREVFDLLIAGPLGQDTAHRKQETVET